MRWLGAGWLCCGLICACKKCRCAAAVLLSLLALVSSALPPIEKYRGLMLSQYWLDVSTQAGLLLPWPLFNQQEAIKAVQAEARAKFDESVELHMRLGIDPRRGDQVGKSGS